MPFRRVVAGLARRALVPESAEQVVGELEGFAERVSVGEERVHGLRASVAEEPAEAERPADRVGPGLEVVHARDVRVGREIEVLAEDDFLLDAQEGLHGLAAARLGERRLHEELEGIGAADVARENGEAVGEMALVALPEGGVHRRAAAALVVLVHPVVVDEQIALEELEGGAGAHGIGEGALGRDAGCRRREHHGAEALAPTERQVPDALDELDALRRDLPGLGHLLLEVRAELGVHEVTNAGEKIGEGLGHRSLRCGALAKREARAYPPAWPSARALSVPTARGRESAARRPVVTVRRGVACVTPPAGGREHAAPRSEPGRPGGDIMSSEASNVLDIGQRKADHLDLCATDAVAFKKVTTLLEEVRLVHQSLPDLAVDGIDLSTTLLGKTLRAPIVIAAMTGGHERAAEVNHTLAAIANDRGYGFGLGSQRAMQKRPDTAWTFQVREKAPDVLLLGNVGVVQARDMDVEIIATMIEQVGADALCVHLNPAMELVQPGGDRDFTRGTETVARLVKALPVPVVGKETGNGISAETARKLRDAGVSTVDTSGAGGTSWVGVETLRAEGDQKTLGEMLWDWGVPTAASVHNVVRCGMHAIATGGMKNGYDVARAIALGASAGGFARQVFQAFVNGGREGAEAFLNRVENELRAVMLLSGAQNVDELRRAPRMIGPQLREWMTLTDR